MNSAPAKDQLFEPAIPPIGGYELTRPSRDLVEDRTDIFGSPGMERPSRCNLGHTEQNIRLAIGTGFLVAAAFAPVRRGWKLGFAAFGISQIAMGATRFCPLWHALGIDTRKADEL